MFTVCSKCNLRLTVTAQDLRAAQGYVRCAVVTMSSMHSPHWRTIPLAKPYRPALPTRSSDRY